MVKTIFYTCTLFLLCFSCSSDGGNVQSGQTFDSNEKEYVRKVSPADFIAQYEATPGAVMVDVRTPKEYVGGKIVPEAVNVDYHGDKFLEQILAHDREAPIFVYCFSGGRSAKAAYKMKQLGFKKIYDCAGGYQQWEKEQKK